MKKAPESEGIRPEYDFSGATRGRYAGRFYVDPSTPPGRSVVLRRAMPDQGLEQGDVGRIVGAYHEDRGFEVEFTFGSENGSVRVELPPGDLRFMQEREILHTREVERG